MKAGVENNVKIAMIPLGKDKVLLRLGNMIDSKDQMLKSIWKRSSMVYGSHLMQEFQFPNIRSTRLP